MVSVLINIIQHEQYLHFRHTFLLSAHFSPSHVTSCSSLMSDHQVNNKCNNSNNNSKRMGLRFLIYALCNFLLRNMLHIFRRTTVLESFTNSTGKQLCWSLFFSLKLLSPICLSNSYFFQ